MGKEKRNQKKTSAAAGTGLSADSAMSTPLTTSAINSDPILGYKLRVLIYDLRNIIKDLSSEKRINVTTDEHYISLPYFSPEQVKVVKNATADVQADPRLDFVALDVEDVELPPEDCVPSKTIEESMHSLLNNFLEKRRAGGDARPCGPHHLAPMYAALFGIKMEELPDEKFLTCLRRNGV